MNNFNIGDRVQLVNLIDVIHGGRFHPNKGNNVGNIGSVIGTSSSNMLRVQ